MSHFPHFVSDKANGQVPIPHFVSDKALARKFHPFFLAGVARTPMGS